MRLYPGMEYLHSRHTAILAALALWFMSLFICYSASAQSREVTFVPVAPEELSSTFVRCIYKDSRGFMWFGTGTGLVRYDGTNVYRYDQTQRNASAITDNRINAILEDANHHLWIGTSQGLVLYDPEKDSFVDVDSIPGNANYLNNRYISALSLDRSGRIWIGTLGNGLNVYDPVALTFTHLGESTSTGRVPPANYVTSLLVVDGVVWVGTKGGLKLYDSKTARMLPLPASDSSVANKEITQVQQDRTGSIWLTTMDREIIKLRPEIESYRVQKMTLRPSMLVKEEGSIVTLAPNADGHVWVAGENTGLNYLDANLEQIVHYEAAEGSPGKLPTNSIRSVFIDDAGITWIGTYNRGVYMIDSNAKRFDLYQRGEFIQADINGDNVKGLAEDRNGNIWIASDGGGLGVLNVTNHKLQYAEAINRKLDTRYLTSLFFDVRGNLWIGTWGRGVYRVDLASGEVQNYKVESNGFGDNKVYCIYQDSRKTIWVGSVGSGLFYFDPASARFIGLNEEKQADYIRKSAYVTTILEDADSTLWVGTLFGIYRHKFLREGVYDIDLFRNTTGKGSLGSYDIQTIYEDARQNLWFGTGDRGMKRLAYRDTVFTGVDRHDGLISNTIRGILADRHGNFWISSNRGLSRYDPVAQSFKNYSREDGLPSNEFNVNACLKARDGKLYFGSDRGLVSFYPDSIRDNPTAPVVYLTDLKLNNQSVRIGAEGSPITKHISYSDAIELSYAQRSFAIDFVAVNYGQSSGNQYCYKLEGFDEEWNCIGSNNRATYTNIDAGHYVFLVRASNSDGVSSVDPARVEITIAQAPWKTWWAWLLYAALIGSAAYAAVRIHVERIKIRNQLEFERLAREREHSLSESKTQFFTNVSHELRTPLSLITMPLESLSQLSNLPSAAQDALATMRMSAGKMTRLVNELMDFNKLENSKLGVRVQRGELVQFTARIVSEFRDLAATRNIHFGIHAMVRSLEGWFDRDKLEKILVNVLSNAFKFTPDGGQINVMINVKYDAVKDKSVRTRFLELTVIDNGIGIANNELPFIFDKFYQASSSSKVANPGTGIGLALTKGLVDLHHGSIKAESAPSDQTTFVILLPIDREAFSDEEIHDADCLPDPNIATAADSHSSS
ncbi:MAG: ATP-binding protein, partial [Bacteroidota bacterium]|nr:ATP-binding protein [Bacteroidota bacterium]